MFVCSPSSAATFLGASRQRRSDARWSGQPDVRRNWFTDARGPVAARITPADSRGVGSSREECPDASRGDRVRNLHVCRSLRPRQH